MTRREQYIERSTVRERKERYLRERLISQIHRTFFTPTSLSFHCESNWISGFMLFKKYSYIGRNPNLSLLDFPCPPVAQNLNVNTKDICLVLVTHLKVKCLLNFSLSGL